MTPKLTGRRGYAPADLLKLYIYGYLNRVRSSRRLEAETHRNIEVIWLLRHLKPDFKTIADFRRDKASAFRPIFRQFVLLVAMGLLTQTAGPAKEVLGVETIAVVADRGYFQIEDIEFCETAGMVPYVPRPQRGPSVKAGLFRKDEFQYDTASDS